MLSGYNYFSCRKRPAVQYRWTKIALRTNELCSIRYGDNCQFAHSVKELNQVHRHPRYKTQLCKSFQSQGFCKYNDRCTFIHHSEEARVPQATSTIRGSSSAQSPWSS